MSSVSTGIIVLVCAFGGALLGMFLRTVLPKHHLDSETKDVVKLGMGLVGTMAALILGLLVTSARGNYDAQSAELTQVSTNILMLDRVLAHYGPETNEAREALKVTGVRALDKVSSQTRQGHFCFRLNSRSSPKISAGLQTYRTPWRTSATVCSVFRFQYRLICMNSRCPIRPA